MTPIIRRLLATVRIIDGRHSTAALQLVVSRYTEIPNRYPIFSNTDTDTDVGILNTENTENSVRYSLLGAVSCVNFETGQLNLSYYDIWSWRVLHLNCECVFAGDFNVNLDGSD